MDHTKDAIFNYLEIYRNRTNIPHWAKIENLENSVPQNIIWTASDQAQSEHSPLQDTIRRLVSFLLSNR